MYHFLTCGLFFLTRIYFYNYFVLFFFKVYLWYSIMRSGIIPTTHIVKSSLIN